MVMIWALWMARDLPGHVDVIRIIFKALGQPLLHPLFHFRSRPRW